MTLFSFDVEFDQMVYEQVGMEMENRGTRRATQTFNVVAESRNLAEGEVVNNRNFYQHQHPKVQLVSETPVHEVVLVQRLR
jgi:hypothetical protein